MLAAMDVCRWKEKLASRKRMRRSWGTAMKAPLQLICMLIIDIMATELLPVAHAVHDVRRVYQRVLRTDVDVAQSARATSASGPSQHLEDWATVGNINCSRLGPTIPGGIARCVSVTEDSVAVSPVRPIAVPKTKSCSLPILENAIFGPFVEACKCFSPPVIRNLDLPEDCGRSWAKIILKWKVYGQNPPNYDRIGTVFVEGVEVFRTSTQEPFRRPPQRMFWEVEKDVTRFASLFKNRKVTTQAGIGNLVVDRYVGIYNASASLFFYQKEDGDEVSKEANIVLRVTKGELATGVSGIMNDEHNSLDQTYTLPRNIVRASLEVNAHAGGLCEEFYYFDLPNEYFNYTTPKGLPRLTDFCLNPAGGFREVVALVDGNVAGVAWPFPSIFTGGVEPLLWRPIVATRAFDLPTYTFDITPFVGTLVDGMPHNFSFRVLGTDNRFASGSWFITASIHLWIDHKCSQTSGAITTIDPFPVANPTVSVKMLCPDNSDTCFDGVATVMAQRTFHIAGYVTSSAGRVETSVTTELSFNSRNSNKNFFNETEIKNDVVFSTVVQRTTSEEPKHDSNATLCKEDTAIDIALPNEAKRADDSLPAEITRDTFRFPLTFLVKSSVVDPIESIRWSSFKVDHAYRHDRFDDTRLISSMEDYQLASGFVFTNITTGDLLLPLAFINKVKYSEIDPQRGCYKRGVLGGFAYPGPDPKFVPYQIIADKIYDTCPTPLSSQMLHSLDA